MAWTRDDVGVGVFCVVDPDTAEVWAQVAKVGDRHNTSWLIQRYGHRTPKEAYQTVRVTAAA